MPKRILSFSFSTFQGKAEEVQCSFHSMGEGIIQSFPKKQAAFRKAV
jgi:ATP-dependent Clp protease adapter protein ClpS